MVAAVKINSNCGTYHRMWLWWYSRNCGKCRRMWLWWKSSNCVEIVIEGDFVIKFLQVVAETLEEFSLIGDDIILGLFMCSSWRRSDWITLTKIRCGKVSSTDYKNYVLRESWRYRCGIFVRQRVSLCILARTAASIFVSAGKQDMFLCVCWQEVWWPILFRRENRRQLCVSRK